MTHLASQLIFFLFIGFTFGVSTAYAQSTEESVRVMCYNIHPGVVLLSNRYLKQPRSSRAKADIVGIQETRSPRGDTLEDLAKLLGWNYDEGSCIVTRYEIVEFFKGERITKAVSRSSLLQVCMPTFLTCTSHPIPTNPISFWAFALSGINTPMILLLSKPRQRRLIGQKRHDGAEIGRLLRQVKSIPDKEVPIFVVGGTFTPGLDRSCRQSRSPSNQSGLPHFHRNGQGWL